MSQVPPLQSAQIVAPGAAKNEHRNSVDPAMVDESVISMSFQAIQWAMLSPFAELTFLTFACFFSGFLRFGGFSVVAVVTILGQSNATYVHTHTQEDLDVLRLSASHDGSEILGQFFKLILRS